MKEGVCFGWDTTEMDHQDSFDSWLNFQRFPSPLPADAEPVLRKEYETLVERFIEHDPTRWMRQPLKPGEHRYAVVIDDGQKRWVTLCVVRSPKGEYFILIPRDSGWDPHSSYHLDGRYHHKSHGQVRSSQQRQPLSGFRGQEHLGIFMGHGTHMAAYQLSNYTAALMVPIGTLSGLPDQQIVAERIFKDAAPWIAIAVRSGDVTPVFPLPAAVNSVAHSDGPADGGHCSFQLRE